MRPTPRFTLLLACLASALADSSARADPARVEAGVVTLDRWTVPAFERMSASAYGERAYDVDVPLRQTWATPPLVVATLSMVDADQSANLRLQVIVVSVGTTSFRLRFRTWADTRIWGAGASWFAIDAPPGSQPVPPVVVLGPSPKSGVLAPDPARKEKEAVRVLSPPPPPPPPPPPDPKAAWRQCARGSRFGCMARTQGVAPVRGEEPPQLCGCIPDCSGLFVFASAAEGSWPDGSAKGSFHCSRTLPP